MPHRNAPAQPTCLTLTSLDRWLHQALHASWGAVTTERLPAELMAIIEGQSGNAALQQPRIPRGERREGQLAA